MTSGTTKSMAMKASRRMRLKVLASQTLGWAAKEKKSSRQTVSGSWAVGESVMSTGRVSLKRRMSRAKSRPTLQMLKEMTFMEEVLVMRALRLIDCHLSTARMVMETAVANLWQEDNKKTAEIW